MKTIEDHIERVLDDTPVSGTSFRYWVENYPLSVQAMEKYIAMGGNPWVVGADERHFEQFAEKEDRDAFDALTLDEARALIVWIDC